jgi:uncharacterized protein (DUF4415 family)
MDNKHNDIVSVRVSRELIDKFKQNIGNQTISEALRELMVETVNKQKNKQNLMWLEKK